MRCEEVRLHKLNSIPDAIFCALETVPSLVRDHARFASCSQQRQPWVYPAMKGGAPLAVRRVSALSLRIDIRYSDLDVNIRSCGN